jgi:hypothetical protein
METGFDSIEPARDLASTGLVRFVTVFSKAAGFSKMIYDISDTGLLLDHRAGGVRLQFDLAERGFVLLDVLRKNVGQSLSLLWAEKNPLKVVNGDRIGGGLINRAETEEKVPEAHAHLHAVGVVFAVIGSAG